MIAALEEELERLLIAEADAWCVYLDATRSIHGIEYAVVEPWAWARLRIKLRAVERRRARLKLT